MKYILSEKEQGCFFCQNLAAPEQDREHFVLYRGVHAFILLNVYPYNNGHLLIAPAAHVSSLTALEPAQLTDVFCLTRLCEQILGQAMHPEGFNVGVNLGKVAGAGVADHLHVHIVPRWNGDSNYMTTLAQTRIIPQQLEDTYLMLKPLFDQALQDRENGSGDGV